MYDENYPRYYCAPYCPYAGNWHFRPQYPAIDTTLLNQSANETKKLMNDANIVIDKIAGSQEFDAELMNAAQISDKEKVKRLIHSTGISSDVDIHFNPDGLRLTFNSQTSGKECCKLLIALRWR